MATKRTPLKRRVHHRITPEAVEAFKAGDFHRLHYALGLRPWEESPLNAHCESPPDWIKGTLQIANLKNSWALRQELLKAAEQ